MCILSERLSKHTRPLERETNSALQPATPGKRRGRRPCPHQHPLTGALVQAGMSAPEVSWNKSEILTISVNYHTVYSRSPCYWAIGRHRPSDRLGSLGEANNATPATECGGGWCCLPDSRSSGRNHRREPRHCGSALDTGPQHTCVWRRQRHDTAPRHATTGPIRPGRFRMARPASGAPPRLPLPSPPRAGAAARHARHGKFAALPTTLISLSFFDFPQDKPVSR